MGIIRALSYSIAIAHCASARCPVSNVLGSDARLHSVRSTCRRERAEGEGGLGLAARQLRYLQSS